VPVVDQPVGQDRHHPLDAAIARAVEAGRHGITWENVAALWSAAYFSWHSEEVDEFGRDAKFTETIRPLLEFLYTMWWRVEPAGVENVPGGTTSLPTAATAVVRVIASSMR